MTRPSPGIASSAKVCPRSRLHPVGWLPFSGSFGGSR